jgi:hypothetical protein
LAQQGRPFCHGFEIHFEGATAQFELAAFRDQAQAIPMTLWNRDGRVLTPRLPGGDAIAPFEAEIAEVLRCLQDDCDSRILGGELARDAIQIAQMQSDAVLAHHHRV